MSEKGPGKQIDPRLLSPEYWEHDPKDNCDWVKRSGQGIPFRQQDQLSQAGKALLRDFLAVVDREPIRTFGQGELFDGNQFPEGTIIQYEREELRLADELRRVPYERLDRWGVVSGYNTQGSRKLVIMEHVVSPGRWISPGLPREIVIRVGETSHLRIKRKGYVSESLRRVNKVNLYKFGKGVREEVRQERKLPNFRAILHPEPQET